jgi:hypothetical protein
MKTNKLLVGLLAALAICGSANAAILTGTSGSPGNAVVDYSKPSVVSFDLDLKDFSATTLNFVVEEADLLLPHLTLSAIVRNFSGNGLEQFRFAVHGVSFAAAGSVTPTFGTLGNVTFRDNMASIAFSSPEWAEFHFGDPFAAGQNDWLLSNAGLRAGDTFSVTASVPEPATISLMLAALATFAFTRLLRDKR